MRGLLDETSPIPDKTTTKSFYSIRRTAQWVSNLWGMCEKKKPPKDLQRATSSNFCEEWNDFLKLQSLQLPRKMSRGEKSLQYFYCDKNNLCAYLVNMIPKDCRRASGGQLSSLPAVRKLFNTILSLSSIDRLRCPVWCVAWHATTITQSQRCHVTLNCVCFGFSDFQVKDAGLHNKMRLATIIIS